VCDASGSVKPQLDAVDVYTFLPSRIMIDHDLFHVESGELLLRLANLACRVVQRSTALIGDAAAFGLRSGMAVFCGQSHGQSQTIYKNRYLGSNAAVVLDCRRLFVRITMACRRHDIRSHDIGCHVRSRTEASRMNCKMSLITIMHHAGPL
jgi:hypothetical protein